jgi:hypothetical protein
LVVFDWFGLRWEWWRDGSEVVERWEWWRDGSGGGMGVRWWRDGSGGGIRDTNRPVLTGPPEVITRVTDAVEAFDQNLLAQGGVAFTEGEVRDITDGRRSPLLITVME